MGHPSILAFSFGWTGALFASCYGLIPAHLVWSTRHEEEIHTGERTGTDKGTLGVTESKDVHLKTLPHDPKYLAANCSQYHFLLRGDSSGKFSPTIVNLLAIGYGTLGGEDYWLVNRHNSATRTPSTLPPTAPSLFSQWYEEALSTIGLISEAIDTTKPTFAFYRSGVYNEPTCSQAVNYVVYGTLGGDDYWLSRFK
ncbi:hypothetical protein Q8A73_007422 [Channa argus]|nr:hypothetical protein Q8A73_007422 [Channa argus]